MNKLGDVMKENNVLYTVKQLLQCILQAHKQLANE